MTETAGTRTAQVATELPSRWLPAAQYRDLPEPRKLGNYIGASVILSATALGSGELILWPYITSQVGIGLAWLAVLGITMQFFLNMEISRYTLVTGETAVTGFSRMWLPWGILFMLGAILPNIWPGWATSGATVSTFFLGLDESAVTWLTPIFLLSIGLAVTVSPVIYKTLEKAEGVMVVVILVFMVIAIAIATDAGAWGSAVSEAPSGAANLGNFATQLGLATLFGAIVFAGAGGANNLVQSNYVRDKGLAMGIHIPHIVSPITGEEVAEPGLGYVPPSTPENERRWKSWWRIANQEQLIVFWAIGALLLVGLMVLVYSTIGQGNVGESLDFIAAEGEALGTQVGPWFETFFYVAGFLMLFSTNIGVVDYVGRLVADALKVSFLKDSQFWSESKLYISVVWLLILTGCSIVLAGIEPVVLLVISSATGGFVMAFYSVLLIALNRKTLPEFARLKGWRLPIMVFCALFYVTFAAILTYQMVTQGPASLA